MKRYLLIALLTASSVAYARDDGRWANSPLVVQQWFKSLMQPDDPHMSCCGEADAFEADMFEVEGDHYVAIITDGKDAIPNGTRILVPNKKMKTDGKPPNPTGHGIIFLGKNNVVYCHIAPSGI